MHCSRPEKWQVSFSFAPTKKTKKHLEGEHPLFELLQDALIWGPQHIVDLGNLVQLIDSRKEWIQAETQKDTTMKLSTIVQ